MHKIEINFIKFVQRPQQYARLLVTGIQHLENKNAGHATSNVVFNELCLDHSPSSLLPSYRALNTENAFLKHWENPRYTWMPWVPEEGPTLHTAGKLWGGNITQPPSSSPLLLAPDAGYFQAQDNTKAV